MIEDVFEFVADLIGMAAYPVAATVLAAIGSVAELAGVQNLQSGHSLIGGWEVFIGLIALYTAVNVARDHVLPRYRAED